MGTSATGNACGVPPPRSNLQRSTRCNTKWVYHYTGLYTPTRITAQHWTRNIGVFSGIETLLASGGIGAAASEAASLFRGDPGLGKNLVKVWAELAYEHVRALRRPEALSRLDARFAFRSPVDAYDALATWEGSPGDKRVWLGRLQDGAETTEVDVTHYAQVFHPEHLDQSDWWIAARQEYEERAIRYWEPGKLALIELLVVPGFDLVRRVSFRDVSGFGRLRHKMTRGFGSTDG